MATARKQEKFISLKEGALLAETIYKPEEKQTAFAVCDNGQMSEEELVTVRSGFVAPIIPEKDLITYDLVKFPSAVDSYESDTALYEEVKEFVHKYVDIEEYFESLTAVYVMMTWVYDKFYEIPYLRVRGMYGSGKSRFLDVVGSVCYKPLKASGANTEASFFRTMDEVRGTLVLDEANFRFTGRETVLIKMFNDGNKRGGTVMRMKQSARDKGFEREVFNVFGPKIIASSSEYKDDAFESRCISYLLSRVNIRTDIPQQLPEHFQDEALALRNKLLAYRFANAHKPLRDVEWLDIEVHPRLKQVSLPLLQVLDTPEVRDNLHTFITAHHEQLREAERMTEAFDVLLAILELQSEEPDELHTVGEIANQYNLNSGGDNLTPNAVGRIIRTQLGLQTKKRANGFVLLGSRHNSARLEFLRNRFDLDDERAAESEPSACSESQGETPVSDEELGEIGKKVFG